MYFVLMHLSRSHISTRRPAMLILTLFSGRLQHCGNKIGPVCSVTTGTTILR